MSELSTKTLVEITGLLQHRKVSVEEVVAACLQRIEATEPRIQALLCLDSSGAMEQAKALDKAGPRKDQPLWGVPISLKDTIITQGMETTCASGMLKGFIPCYDAELVRRLKKAGAIILGKTNMDEFAMGSTTENSARAVTSNPWDTTRVPGGSSGGSAASVAACQAFVSIGTDTGGSVRQPASFCGIVGLKPTYGRVSRYGLVSYASSFDQAGPMTRTVADGAAILEVIAGHDSKDSTSVREPVPSYTNLLAKRQDLKGLRFGIPTEYWQGLSPEVDTALRHALETIHTLGGSVTEISLPHTRYAVAAYYILASAEASSNLAMFDGVRYGFRDPEATELKDMYTGSRSKGFGREVKRRIILGTYALSTGYYDAYYKKAAQVRRLILQDFEQAFTACDCLCAPVCPTVAFKKSEKEKDPLQTYLADIFSIPLNLAGLPGLSLPAGRGRDSGMPVGLQLMGGAFTEGLLLQIGHILEQQLPGERPPL